MKNKQRRKLKMAAQNASVPATSTLPTPGSSRQSKHAVIITHPSAVQVVWADDATLAKAPEQALKELYSKFKAELVGRKMDKGQKVKVDNSAGPALPTEAAITGGRNARKTKKEKVNRKDSSVADLTCMAADGVSVTEKASDAKKKHDSPALVLLVTDLKKLAAEAISATKTRTDVNNNNNLAIIALPWADLKSMATEDVFVNEPESETKKENVSATSVQSDTELANMATDDVSITEEEVKKVSNYADTKMAKDKYANMAAVGVSATNKVEEAKKEDVSIAPVLQVADLLNMTTEDNSVISKLENISSTEDKAETKNGNVSSAPEQQVADPVNMDTNDMSSTERKAYVKVEDESVAPVLPFADLLNMTTEDNSIISKLEVADHKDMPIDNVPATESESEAKKEDIFASSDLTEMASGDVSTTDREADAIIEDLRAVPVTDLMDLTTGDVSSTEKERDIKTEDVCVAEELPTTDKLKMAVFPEKETRAPAALPHEEGEEIQTLIREEKITDDKQDQIHVLKDALNQPNQREELYHEDAKMTLEKCSQMEREINTLKVALKKSEAQREQQASIIKTLRADYESAKQASSAVTDRLRQALLEAEMENKRLALENSSLKEKKATIQAGQSETTRAKGQGDMLGNSAVPVMPLLDVADNLFAEHVSSTGRETDTIKEDVSVTLVPLISDFTDMANKVATEREAEEQKENVSAAVELEEAYFKDMATENVSTTVEEADVKEDVSSAPLLRVEDLINMADKDVPATGEKTYVKKEESSAGTVLPKKELKTTATGNVSVDHKETNVKMKDNSAGPDLTNMVTEVLSDAPVTRTADLTKMTAEDICATERRADVVRENVSVTPEIDPSQRTLGKCHQIEHEGVELKEAPKMSEAQREQQASIIKTLRADYESAKQASSAVTDRLRQALLEAEMENKRLALENSSLKEKKATIQAGQSETTRAKGQGDMLGNSAVPVLPLLDVADNLFAEHVSSTGRETDTIKEDVSVTLVPLISDFTDMANKVSTKREAEEQKENVSAAVELEEAYFKDMDTEDVSTTVEEADVKEDVSSAPLLRVEDLINMADKDVPATGEKTYVKKKESSAGTVLPKKELKTTATGNVSADHKETNVKMKDNSAGPDLTNMVTEVLSDAPVMRTADLTKMTAEDICATERRADVVRENVSVTPEIDPSQRTLGKCHQIEHEGVELKEAPKMSEAEREQKATELKTLMAENEATAQASIALLDGLLHALLVAEKEKENLALDNSLLREENYKLTIKELNTSKTIQSLQENQEIANKEHNAKLKQIETEWREKEEQWKNHYRAMAEHLANASTAKERHIEQELTKLESMLLKKEEEWNKKMNMMEEEMERKLQMANITQPQVCSGDKKRSIRKRGKDKKNKKGKTEEIPACLGQASE